MNTEADQKIKTLESQVETLQKIVDQTIDVKFLGILHSFKSSKNKDTLKTEVNSILCNFKNTNLPDEWYTIYRQTLLNQVKKYFGRKKLKISRLSDELLSIIEVCAGLFDKTSAEQMQLIEFMFDCMLVSSSLITKFREKLQKTREKLGEVREIRNIYFLNLENNKRNNFDCSVQKMVREILTDYNELKLEIIKKFAVNEKWLKTDSVTYFVSTLYFDASDEFTEFEDKNLTNLKHVFLEFYIKQISGYSSIIHLEQNDKPHTYNNKHICTRPHNNNKIFKPDRLICPRVG